MVEQWRKPVASLVVLHQPGQPAAVGPQVAVPVVGLGHGEVNDVVGVGGKGAHVPGGQVDGDAADPGRLQPLPGGSSSLNRAAPTTWLCGARARATGSATWPVTPVTTMVLPDRGSVEDD